MESLVILVVLSLFCLIKVVIMKVNFQQLCELLDFRKKRATPRHHSCNGKTEQFNRTLMKMIKIYIKDDKTEWDLYLGCFGAAYRSSVHETTGLTPNLLMLEREVRVPSEIIFGSKTWNRDQSVTDYGTYVENFGDKLQASHCIARKNLQFS